MKEKLIEVTQHSGFEGVPCIQLGMSRETFAEFMGYASLDEMVEAHETWTGALEHWRERWAKMGFEVVIN